MSQKRAGHRSRGRAWARTHDVTTVYVRVRSRAHDKTQRVKIGRRDARLQISEHYLNSILDAK